MTLTVTGNVIAGLYVPVVVSVRKPEHDDVAGASGFTPISAVAAPLVSEPEAGVTVIGQGFDEELVKLRL